MLSRIPKDPVNTKMPSTERMQVIVGVLNELDKLAPAVKPPWAGVSKLLSEGELAFPSDSIGAVVGQKRAIQRDVVTGLEAVLAQQCRGHFGF